MKQTPQSALAALALFALICVGVSAVNVRAATITVTNTADSGPGTLRAALMSAANGDKITFSLPTPAIITLTSGELLITNSVAISGPGANKLAVNGNHAYFTIFDIAPSNVVTISGLTITNANSYSFGGGINNQDSDLTISNCTVAGNYADFGGGIQNLAVVGSANLKIINSTFSGNTAGFAGAIYNVSEGPGDAQVQIVNSTLSGNFANNFGGAIVNVCESAANTETHIKNSTFSNNSQNSTFGGAIVNLRQGSGGANIDLGSSILNGDASGETIYNDSGSVTSLGYNLSSDDAGRALTMATDRINTNPVLGPLQDNGGPTFTHAPASNSPAIDHGKNFSGLASDQRGSPYIRLFDNPAAANAVGGDGTDIGSFELQPISAAFTVVNRNDSGPGSLRQAILNANNHPGPDIIEFAPGVNGSILLTSGELLITDDLLIHGPGATNLAVDGNAASRIFHMAPTNGLISTGRKITNSITVTLSGLTITNGYFDGAGGFGGGGILNQAAVLLVNDCTVSGNSSFHGAGINNSSFTGNALLAISNSTVSGNSPGFGIENYSLQFGSANLDVVGCLVSSNAAGGIDNISSGGSANVRIMKSTLSGNTGGGGVRNVAQPGGYAYLQILNSTFGRNSATLPGNGGNISSSSSGGSVSVDIGSTILDSDPLSGNILNSGGLINSLGYNLSSDDANSFLTNATDRVNTDPKLGPLQDNGGPTFTHAFTCQSPAIDGGTNFSGTATDQRGVGFARTFDNPLANNNAGGDGTDIGAFEAQQPLSLCDLPPVADASATATLVISPNNTNATVILDGSRSSDRDSDPLQYTWYESGGLLTTGVVAVTVLPVGTHPIELVVDDGTLRNTNGVIIEIITTAEAVNRLAATLSAEVPRPQPLLASIKAALASIDRSNPVSAINQLFALQNKLRAQLAPLDSMSAASLIQSAQNIIDSLSAGGANPGGHPAANFTAVIRQANGHVRMRFSANASGPYIIEASTNLLNWEMIGIAAPSASGGFDFEDPQGAGHSSRLYRVRSQ